MRVCVLYGEAASENRCKEIAGALAEGIQTQGHIVDVVDMTTEVGKIISFYDYIAVGTSSISLWGGKIPVRVEDFLKQCGTIAGKRSFAFIVKKGLRQNKTLQALMHAMESQGMYLTFSDILANKASARETGKRLIIS